MTQIDYIKHLREVEGWSINKIAGRMNHAWATAKKYADGNIDLRARGKRNRKATVIGPFEYYRCMAGRRFTSAGKAKADSTKDVFRFA